MDYVFTRGENRQWYLTALKDSDMKVEATPTPAPTDSAVDALQNDQLDTADSIPVEEPASDEETAPVEDAPAEG